MYINLLLLFIPISLALEYFFHFSPTWVFITAALGIIPLAEWIRRATEQLALKAGPAIGALINISFGNLAELILALFVLLAGHTEVVKAQITGSIIGNGLLGLGLAVLLGSIKHGTQKFDSRRAGLLSSLLLLVVIALLLPALFDYTETGVFGHHASNVDEYLSLGVSIVLIIVYATNLVYSLTRRHDVFRVEDEQEEPHWSNWKSFGVLIVATIFTAWESELVSSGLTATSQSFGLSTFFLGIIVLAIIGNVPEYIASIFFARENRMNMTLGITIGSSVQVGLLLAPLLVILSYLFGTPMNLVFGNPLELFAVFGVAFAANAITEDGETNWFEGVLLIAIYVLLAIAFFFVKPNP